MKTARLTNFQVRLALSVVAVLAVLLAISIPAPAQSSPSQSQQPAQSQPSSSQPAQAQQPAQDLPDDPSVVQPPAPKPKIPVPPPNPNRDNEPIPFPGDEPKNQPDGTNPPPMGPVETVPPGTLPRNQVSPQDDLYKLVVKVNFVMLPVMVKDSQNRRVDGLLPKDFTVLENNKPQKLAYFASDPFVLSVAILLDTGMADVSLQKINETYSALVGAFSPYDEVALYTYSSTVSQVTDFNTRSARLTAALDEIKLVRGRNNGAPVLGGPLGPQGPMINGMPAGGGMSPPPVYTPPRESHVLNDAILRAALDLSAHDRDHTRRKVIFVISDGRELGSRARYKDVLRVLQTRDIQVRAVTLDSGALPGYRQLSKIHMPLQGYNNILPKYVFATCGEQDLARISRNAIEEAYAEITSDARNQYTLGYTPEATTGSAAYRSVEVRVHKKGLSVYARDGYYPVPSPH